MASDTAEHARALGTEGLCEDEHTPRAPARIIQDVKPPEVSAEAALNGELAALALWLAAQGLDLHSDQAHNSRGWASSN